MCGRSCNNDTRGSSIVVNCLRTGLSSTPDSHRLKKQRKAAKEFTAGVGVPNVSQAPTRLQCSVGPELTQEEEEESVSQVRTSGYVVPSTLPTRAELIGDSDQASDGLRPSSAVALNFNCALALSDSNSQAKSTPEHWGNSGFAG